MKPQIIIVNVWFFLGGKDFYLEGANNTWNFSLI
jgi:hypothetical protein